MFDAGVNLLDRRFDPVEVIHNAAEAGLTGMLIISSDIEESDKARQFCHQYNGKPIQLRYTAGVHPHAASTWTNKSFDQLRLLAADKLCAAIGECGLDFNRNFSTPEEQKYAFLQQLKIAEVCNMGLYLHERDAFATQVDMLQKYAENAKFKVAHCFTGGIDNIKTYLALDCFIGITGWLCDPKRAVELREAVSQLPLNRLLLETDAPYLFPKNIRPRAKNNEPKLLNAIAIMLSELINVDIVEIQRCSAANAQQLFLSK